jgi:hypothetical protein
MSTTAKVWIGADPGGINKFGVCILDTVGNANTFCVDCTDDAVFPGFEAEAPNVHDRPTRGYPWVTASS